MSKVPPPVSVVAHMMHRLQGLLISEMEDRYREAWFDTLDSLRSASLERQAPSAEGPGYSDPTGKQLADAESRRRSLSQASDKLEKAFELTKDAKGLIDYASGRASSGVKDGTIQTWTKQEMDAANGQLPPKGKVRT